MKTPRVAQDEAVVVVGDGEVGVDGRHRAFGADIAHKELGAPDSVYLFNTHFLYADTPISILVCLLDIYTTCLPCK